MFNSLVESTAPARRRTPRYFVLTFLLYSAVLGGVVVTSIAVDKPALADSLELITMVTLPPPAPPGGGSSRPARETNRVRQITPYAIPNPEATNDPTPLVTRVPTIHPLGDPSLVGDPGPTGPPTGCCGPDTGVVGSAAGLRVVAPPPPPRPAEPSPQMTEENRTIKLSTGVIQGKAINIPKPDYPRIASQIRAQGVVNVEILIDKTGHVISAVAVSGPPLLQAAAVSAAKRAVFQPTRLSGEPVLVQGVISFRFTLN